MKKKRKRTESETSASLIISARYATLKIRERWDQKRVDRFCRFLNITRKELETLVGAKVEKVDTGRRLPMSVCILLTLLEATYLSNYAPDTISNIFDFTS